MTNKMTNKFAHISEFLPHKEPMILIDKLVAVDSLTVHCQVTVSSQSLFFDKQLNAIPAWVGMEFMAQTVAAWSGYQASLRGEKSPIGFLLGSRRYTSECSEFSEGKVLDIYAEQLMENEGMAAFACSIKCDGQELATSQLNAFVPPQDKLQQILGKKD